MTKSMTTGIIIGVVIAATGSVIAGYNLVNREPTHADVVNVAAIVETVDTPREVCREVQVTHQKDVKDDKQTLGTVAGAVVGGLLGNQIGGGSGKKVATVAGAAAGGYAGKKTQEKMQQNNTYVTTETQCETVHEQSEVIRGYDVTYMIGKEEGHIKMDKKPGDKIPLVDGQLQL